jgi:hypothetical protein
VMFFISSIGTLMVSPIFDVLLNYIIGIVMAGLPSLFSL